MRTRRFGEGMGHRDGRGKGGDLIVAAARIGRCRVLLTEELQDGQDLGGLLVASPFEHSPDVLSTQTPR